MGTKKNDSQQQLSWKKRPSEIRNYQRTLYTTADNNDYLRVDYNVKTKLVRLYVEVSEEGGSPFYSIIKDGKINIEKSVGTGRSSDFSEKFIERSDYFSTIPAKEVIKLINKNYGIGQPGRKIGQSNKKNWLDETKRRYFKPEHQAGEYGRERVGATFGVIRLIDAVDVIIGLGITGSVFYFLNFDYTAAGVAASFFGITIGLVDILFRTRAPLILKMLIFIVGGFALYLYGYFYHVFK